MKYTSVIDNRTSQSWGLNIQEAYLFDWMYSLPSWASTATIEGKTYYFASKTKAIAELPMLTNKIDTMYRHYKSLEEKGLIVISKIGNQDYICLTEKSKQWNRGESDYSEKNPKEVGKKSDIDSEKNPTYNNTSINNNTKDNNTVVKKLSKKEAYLQKFDEELKKIFEERPALKEKCLEWINYKFDEKKDGYTTIRWLTSELKHSDIQIIEAINVALKREYVGFHIEASIKKPLYVAPTATKVQSSAATTSPVPDWFKNQKKY